MAPQRPEVPRSTTVYQALDHAVMKQQVTDGSDPGKAGRIAAEWKRFGEKLVDAAIAFKTMEEGTSAMWSGKAAEGAQTQFAGFTKATETLGQQHNAVGNAIQTQVSAAETAKHAMPEPVPYEPGKMLKEAATSGNPFKMAATLFTIPAQKAKSEEAKAQAVQVMQNRDSTFTSSAATMPTFTELPQTKEGPSEPPPRPLPHPVDPPGGNDGRNVRPPGGIGVPPGGGTPPGIGMPIAPPPNRPGQGNTKTSWQTGNQNQQNQNQNQNQNQRPGQNPGQRPPIGGPFPPGTRPPGQMPGGARGGGPGGAAAAKAGGGAGGFGGGGKPGGSFGPSNPGGQGQGQTPGGRAGVMGAAGPQAGGFGPANAGSAARGAAGMGAGGMGAGAGQGQGAEDKEHKSAAYLVEAEDVFGDGETLVAPPVIGE